MAIFLFTATLGSNTNLPEDAMVNTFHFEGSGSDPENVVDMIQDFYIVVPSGQSTSIATFMTSAALNGDLTVRGYDLSDTPPRAPVIEQERDLTGLGSGDALPTEVALVMSYHAQYASGVQPARRRGRIYLGGFAASINQGGRPGGGLRQAVQRAGRDLIQASNASVSWDWVQYSPTNGTANLVVGGWIDNAWDTQRRRGIAPTSRDTFTGGTP